MQIKRPPMRDKSDPRFFSFKSAQIRAFKEAGATGDKHFIEGIASSTVEDSYGDVLTEACQASMLAQCQGMTMWLNHSYKVPEDVLGTCVEATLERGTAGDGTGRDDGALGDCLDLRIRVEIDANNPRALKSWQHINDGTKLAFSIGGFFTEAEFIEPDNWDNWGMLVNDIELLEISLVGIPANPRAYTKSMDGATEALRAAVVSRAEEYVRDHKATQRDARVFVIKSLFGGESAEEVPVEKCAHKDGCENDKADDSLLCVEHRDAAPIEQPAEGEEPVVGQTETPAAEPEAEQPITLSIKDMTEMQAGAVVSALKCIKSAHIHGMCVDSLGHTAAAHAIVKSLLPNDYDLPDDALLDNDGAAVNSAGQLTTKINAEISELEALLATAKTAFDEIAAQRAAVDAEINKMSAERDALLQQVEQLRATPTGRSTVTSHSGGSSENEPTASAELYTKSQTELMAKVSAKSAPGVQSARDTVQNTA